MSRVLPILFNTEMVTVILDEKKTVTRRVAKNIRLFGKAKCRYFDVLKHGKWTGPMSEELVILNEAPYKIGDILYVRERFCIGEIVYGEETDGSAEPYVIQPGHNYIPYEYCIRNRIGVEDVKWRPSIHMPKERARIWLKVTDVHAERLRDITNVEAKKEGVICETNNSGQAHRFKFSMLWNSTIKKADLSLYGWDVNPWVWVIDFEECEKPEGV